MSRMPRGEPQADTRSAASQQASQAGSMAGRAGGAAVLRRTYGEQAVRRVAEHVSARGVQRRPPLVHHLDAAHPGVERGRQAGRKPVPERRPLAPACARAARNGSRGTEPRPLQVPLTPKRLPQWCGGLESPQPHTCLAKSTAWHGLHKHRSWDRSAQSSTWLGMIASPAAPKKPLPV